MMQEPARLRMGMVGGGRGAFIGAVHRTAARLEGGIDLVAGALSSDATRARDSGRDLGLDDDRNHADWRAMLEDERGRPDGERIDLVVVVTPNDTHGPIATAFAEAGMHVVVDKPMTRTVEEAEALVDAVERRGLVGCVTYNYSGFPMVRQARSIVASGELGTIRKVLVEYHQGWLTEAIEAQGQKQAAWRTDPHRSGAGAVGDIGTHAEHLATFVTGLEPEMLSATLTTFVPGRRVDDDAVVQLRYAGGAKGVLLASQVCPGQNNDLRLRAWGSRGGLSWQQEEPETLVVRSATGAERRHRRGDPNLATAERWSRLPAGHGEGFLEAFTNIYAAAARAMRGEPVTVGEDYPGVRDGLRGVRFMHACLESNRKEGTWIPLSS